MNEFPAWTMSYEMTDGQGTRDKEGGMAIGQAEKNKTYAN